MIQNLVAVTTASKLVNKAKNDGNLNLSVVSYLNTIAYYIKYLSTLPQTQDNINKLVTLRALFDKTMNNCPNVCTYRVAINLICGNELETSAALNNPPSVLGRTKDYNGGVYTFIYSDFTNAFNDIDPGDRPKFVRINTLPSYGVIKFFGSAIPAGFVVDLEDIENITYELTVTGALEVDVFSFQTSDDNQKPAFSNEAEFIFDLTGISANKPATIGDNAIEVENNVTTALSLAMFTSQTTPPYNDPENDLIDAIRIDRIHSTNQGTFYLNGIEIVTGQIITREQLSNNEFTHVGADIDTINTDGFEFSARDEGSGIWVQ